MVASDQGKPARESPQIPVVITVIRNQFAPIFTLPSNDQIQLKKDIPINSFITKVQATDADKNVSINALIILKERRHFFFNIYPFHSDNYLSKFLNLFSSNEHYSSNASVEFFHYKL